MQYIYYKLLSPHNHQNHAKQFNLLIKLKLSRSIHPIEAALLRLCKKTHMSPIN